MLSISEFSEMCHLTPQALRFYHTEGLLVPVQVDERTGYRSYAFEQVEQAMLVTLLRDTGMSVKLVRRALDEPDRALALVDRHHEDIRRQRAAQDEAIQAARAVFDTRPEPRPRHVPATTVVTRLVRGTPLGRDAQEWAQTETLIEAATAELVETVREAGLTMLGRPWRTLARENPEQDRPAADGDGPFWIVEVPVAGPGRLPPGFVIREQEAHDEMSIFIPGRNTMAKYCTGILRLLNAHPLGGDTFVNIALLRQEIHDDGVLSSATVESRPR
ncbi:MerR family transcriptional regulator [Actinoplanes sp. NEAU-A12]|uniref:MerR family transcriptional regulator n=1 Tax=Actinoplanes sandaracinus TaxID=3045177 RepID=A0ABT6WGX0_9ACTN|nr:MerR family transcriptional regulator [Actinoplanes sandaracinus]MDI6098974.1 MerR family transcriptional regulator [Actinoplanes sandaracinus]